MQPHYTCLNNCLSTVDSNHRQCPEHLWFEAFFPVFTKFRATDSRDSFGGGCRAKHRKRQICRVACVRFPLLPDSLLQLSS